MDELCLEHLLPSCGKNEQQRDTDGLFSKTFFSLLIQMF